MRREQPKKNRRTAKTFASQDESQATKVKTYVEAESTPWFKANDSTPENTQINKYITARFSEFNDNELIDFLKNSKPYRKIVSDIRDAYIFTEKKSARRKAA